ncbi:9069_t:CDS:2 [Cetraspora pellucida]|uniref:9069_t:CDS:1 n=1 Tax=Cetraspora pellucida TaxID=1433469 RepID=A0ACA9L8P9_9GLOM|nr:9069_t:CDS:2 [Cetraspora pellucida]
MDYSSLFLASAQSSAEVLLVCVSGYLAAKYEIITPSIQKGLSNLIIKVLLPCLLFSETAADIDLSILIQLWPVPVFCATFSVISSLLGMFGGKILRLSLAETKFLMVGVMFNNITSLLLGLLSGMENTSAMQILLQSEDDSPAESVKRGKSYVMLAILFSTLLRWSLGAFLLRKNPSDDPLDLAKPLSKSVMLPTYNDQISLINSLNETINTSNETIDPPNERTSLLATKKNNNKFIIPQTLTKIYTIVGGLMNPPLTASIVALLVSTIAPLKNLFFGDHAPLFVISSTMEYIGTATVPLTLIMLGAQLQNLRSSKGKEMFASISYVISCRYLIMPIIGGIMVMSTKSLYRGDPMLWFILMMLASGPTAINCINLVQLTGNFEEEMAALLFYSYICLAPLITLIVMSFLTIISYST